MHFRIHYTDSRRKARLKMAYLIPAALVLGPVVAALVGLRASYEVLCAAAHQGVESWYHG